MPVSSNSTRSDSLLASPSKLASVPTTPSKPHNRATNGVDSMKKEARNPTNTDLAATFSAQTQTPVSSPSKSHSSSSSLHGSPTKSPGQSSKPRYQEPIFVTSRDYGPSAEPEDTDPQMPQPPTKDLATKRNDRKSKTDAISALSGQDGPTLSITPLSTSGLPGDGIDGLPDPAQHPARKAKIGKPPLPLRFNHAGIDSLMSDQDPGIPTCASTPRDLPPRLRSRLFDLPEAPVFYPTQEQFQDPMRYISWVADPDGGNGKAYGIVKIVPPAGWNPEFVLDQETFRFRTRVQKLNSLSADARASQNYQEQLQKFHAQQGRKRVSIPVIDRKAVDLYQLKLTVASYGGFDSVSRQRKWSEVTRKIGYSEKDSPSLSAQVKAAYTKIILPFEEFLFKAKEQTKVGGSSSVSPSLPHTSIMSSLSSSSSTLQAGLADSLVSGGDGCSNADRTTASKTPEPLGSNSVEVQESFQAHSEANGKRRSTRKRHSEVGASIVSKVPVTPAVNTKRKGVSPHIEVSMVSEKNVVLQPGAEEQMCEICLRGDDGINMLLCDECNRGYHMYCLQPPLTSIPKSQWFCPSCLVGTGHDFGFDDGETHSLYSFWKRAENFKKAWWSARPECIWNPTTSAAGDMDVDDEKPTTNGLARRIPGTDLIVSEDDVEREFWRLVQSPDETVEVEYGADVHSTTHGSALPTPETHPLSPYSKDRWNLNNLPILPASLLQYIKSDISGMTVPWIYVGMIFSTFCWHNEDHYTYSINYQHWGETKTWYGIPGADAEKFEEAMRKAAPDLFETLPDLLFHLTTMMSPDKLKKEGVQVYTCDQRANEFIVTFPKAYHSGFNHGFNLNEAVNFALPDWIFDGLESARRYQHFRKPAVFSHDQLLITVSQQNQTVETAVWLEATMEEMVEREIGKRNALREIIPNLTEEVYEQDVPEHEYQCAHCTMFCYLGQITSEKAEGVACLDHGFEVCNADAPSRWILRQRFSDEQLRNIYAKVAERAAIPRNWVERLKNTLSCNASPPLRTLKSLLHEGEKIQCPLEPLEDLRAFVNAASSWIERANVFLVRKVHKRRSEVGTTSGRSSRRSVVIVETNLNRPDDEALSSEIGSERSLDILNKLLNELNILHFDTPEIASLRAVADEFQAFLVKCEAILKRKDVEGKEAPSIKECESILTLGRSLNIAARQLDELSKYVERRKWIDEVEDAQHTYLYHHEVQSLLERANGCEINDHKLKVELERRSEAGWEWSKKAKALLSGDDSISIKQLDDLIDSSAEVAVVLDTAQSVTGLLSKAKDLQKTLTLIHNSTATGDPPSGEGKDGKDSDENRPNLLPDARRVLRALRTNNLSLEFAEQIQEAVELHDQWRSELNSTLQHLYGNNRRLSDSDKREQLRKLAGKVLEACNVDDDLPTTTTRQCLCRTTNEIKVPSSSGARCRACGVIYHTSCIKVKMADVLRAGESWICPVCLPNSLPGIFKARKAIDISKVGNLVEAPEFGKDRFKFVPVEWMEVEEMVRDVRRLEKLVNHVCEKLSSMKTSEKRFQLGHLFRKTFRCPFDVYISHELTPAVDQITNMLIAMEGEDYADETENHPGPQSSDGFDNMTDAAEREQYPVSVDPRQLPSSISISDDHQAMSIRSLNRDVSQSRYDKKRRRGKRAKLIFREEIGIGAYRDGQPIYCLCHQPESGRMIACDKCLLWFHTHCVRLGDPPNLGDEPWSCPMCCIKAERKYPQAEVRVQDMGNTEVDLWLDVRATLRSNERPVSKVQSWTVPEDKRIVLHLESFQPAIHADETVNKRPRLDADSSLRSRSSLSRVESSNQPLGGILPS